jgi:ABC transporter substrate binding protein/cobalamin-independent methionine synthase catalytic subunit
VEIRSRFWSCLVAKAQRSPGDEPWLPLTERLERAFSSRLADILNSARILLFIAAENDTLSLHEVLLAGGMLLGKELGIEALSPAVSDQQAPTIGFLGFGAQSRFASLLSMFHRGLNDNGFVEGRNVSVEYRWSEQVHELRSNAIDLADRRVSVIAALGGAPAALAAKAATTTIPVVFLVAEDPVEIGLVASFAKRGGNVTGVSTLNIQVGPKRPELMREILPTAARLALLGMEELSGLGWRELPHLFIGCARRDADPHAYVLFRVQSNHRCDRRDGRRRDFYRDLALEDGIARCVQDLPLSERDRPGVYDIHSPRIPEVGEITELLKLARQRLSDAQLWINPDAA